MIDLNMVKEPSLDEFLETEEAAKFLTQSPSSGRGIILERTISESEIMQKLLVARRTQLKELALKNIEPSRVYIGKTFLMHIKGALEKIANFPLKSEIDRSEVFGLPIYEVQDDDWHIHFC